MFLMSVGMGISCLSFFYAEGLLKVSPSERMAISELEEYLASMAESFGIRLWDPLPFKPAASPMLVEDLECGPPPIADHRRSSVINSIKGVVF